MTEKKILIVGGDGLIGSALVSFFRKAGVSLKFTSILRDLPDPDYIYLDLGDEPGKWKVPEDVGSVIFSSGITKLDLCERDRSGTARVNVEGTCSLGKRLIDNGARVVFLSSNLVFDGSKAFPTHVDTVSPAVEYGRQKARAERELLDHGPDSVTVLRLTKVLGSRNGLFDDWKNGLQRGETITPFTDMFMSPIPLSLVVHTIRLVLDRQAAGIFQLSGEKDVSYADAALFACKVLGIDSRNVKPIRASESATRPGVLVTSRTTLDTTRLQEELGMRAPGIEWTLEKAFLAPSMLEGGSL